MIWMATFKDNQEVIDNLRESLGEKCYAGAILTCYSRFNISLVDSSNPEKNWTDNVVAGTYKGSWFSYIRWKLMASRYAYIIKGDDETSIPKKIGMPEKSYVYNVKRYYK